MRTARGLHARLATPDALAAAIERTVRGKRRPLDVAAFLIDRERRLLELLDRLRFGDWRPEGFDHLRVFDPKPRLIARAPVGDRVVHTAIVDALAPVFAPSLMPEDYACRVGLGSHRAVLRLQTLMGRHRWVLHLDVRAYFPSIDPALTLRLVAERVRDDRFLYLLEHVLDSARGLYSEPAIREFLGLPPDWPPAGRGLPIGSATSQYLAAHIYLLAFDHWVKRTARVPGYVRYCDDLFCFGDRRADLRRWRREIASWLATERGLRLKHPEARIRSCQGHLDALGYRITRTDRVALPRTFRRMGRRVAAASRGNGRVAIERSVASSVGVCTF